MWNKPSEKHKHKLNVALAFLGIFLFLVGLWQLDVICAPYVWAERRWREVLPFWYMWETDAYVMFYAWALIGFLLFGVALWFWED